MACSLSGSCDPSLAQLQRLSQRGGASVVILTRGLPQVWPNLTASEGLGNVEPMVPSFVEGTPDQLFG